MSIHEFYKKNRFPFIEPPDSASIENSVVFLKEQVSNCY